MEDANSKALFAHDWAPFGWIQECRIDFSCCPLVCAYLPLTSPWRLWTWFVQFMHWGCHTTWCRSLLSSLPLLCKPRRLYWTLALYAIKFVAQGGSFDGSVSFVQTMKFLHWTCQRNSHTDFISHYPMYTIAKFCQPNYFFIAYYFSVQGIDK